MKVLKMKDIGQRIKELRKSAGLTQKDLAEKCGYSSLTTINKIELGINSVPLSGVEKIAKVFDVPPSYLLGWEATPIPQTIGARIRARRIELGLSQEELARRVGYTASNSRTTIHKVEAGLNNISQDKIILYAKALHMDVMDILGIEDPSPKIAPPSPYPKKIPMLGEIACGTPIFANQEHGECVEVGHGFKADFALTAKGDSMIDADIKDGDIIFCTAQSTVNNGEIGVVIIDNEATLKRVYYYPDKQRLVLQPENKKYEPLVYVGEELETIRIIGKAVALKLN